VPVGSIGSAGDPTNCSDYIYGTEYLDNFEYGFENDCGNYVMYLDKIYNSEGYAMGLYNNYPYWYSALNYNYYRKDHLGNIREVWCGTTHGTSQRTQYYPSGLPWAEGEGQEVQNKKYNGKEWIEAHGLDEYYSQARMYYPAIMRTTTIDPLAEKYYSISPYAWCGNNPVRMVDPDGRAPGDIFLTPTEAAKDFGKTYNDNSVEMGQEYGSKIYKVKSGYTYTVPNVGPSGNDNGSSVAVSSAPKNNKVVAIVHTHGSYSYGNYDDNNYSGKQKNPEDNKRVLNYDIGNSNNAKIKSYLVTPNGSFQMYDPKTGKVKIISQDMYHDGEDKSSPKTPNSAYTPNLATYVVRIGDSLESIGQDHNISAKEIIKQNGLKRNIKLGQVLEINK